MKDIEEAVNKVVDEYGDTLKMLGQDYDVSEWKRIGMERGYWDYFAKQIRREVLDELLEKGHGGGNWRRLIIQIKDK